MSKISTPIKRNRNAADTIFTITGMTKDSHETRCFGFYYALDNAVSAVLENRGGMDEGRYYHYLIIEEIGWGVYSMTRQELWFSFCKGKYRRIQVPHHSKNIFNFGIG